MTDWKLYLLCSQDKEGNIYHYAWSKEDIPNKTVKRLLPKHREDIKHFCVPWWRYYDTKEQVKKELPCIWKRP